MKDAVVYDTADLAVRQQMDEEIRLIEAMPVVKKLGARCSHRRQRWRVSSLSLVPRGARDSGLVRKEDRAACANVAVSNYPARLPARAS